LTFLLENDGVFYTHRGNISHNFEIAISWTYWPEQDGQTDGLPAPMVTMPPEESSGSLGKCQAKMMLNTGCHIRTRCLLSD